MAKSTDALLSAPVDSLRAEVLSVDQVAEMLGMDVKTVYDHANRGRIPHRRLGRRMLFGRRAILEWLNKPLEDSQQRRPEPELSQAEGAALAELAERDAERMRRARQMPATTPPRARGRSRARSRPA